MHLGFDYQELPDVVWKRLAASRQVVLEVDLRTAGVGMADKATLPPGQSLSAMLGPGGWDLLLTALEGFPAAELDRLRPWAAANLVLARLFPTALPVDLAVLREAERRGKELEFLESVDQQAGLLERVMNERALVRLVDEGSPMRRQLQVGARAYRAGDAEALARAALDPSWFPGGAADVDAFIYQRNSAWLDKLLPGLTKGGIFAAVGAAHLVEDRGLIAQLRNHGFEVTRIPR